MCVHGTIWEPVAPTGRKNWGVMRTQPSSRWIDPIEGEAVCHPASRASGWAILHVEAGASLLTDMTSLIKASQASPGGESVSAPRTPAPAENLQSPSHLIPPGREFHQGLENKFQLAWDLHFLEMLQLYPW